MLFKIKIKDILVLPKANSKLKAKCQLLLEVK